MYCFNIQYDDGIEDSHVFTFRSEGDNVEEAIERFRRIYKDERILSVEMLSPKTWNEYLHGDGDIHKAMAEEEAMRQRVINALRDTERR